MTDSTHGKFYRDRAAWERAYMVAAIEEHRGNLAAMSRELGVDYRTMWNAVRRHDLGSTLDAARETNRDRRTRRASARQLEDELAAAQARIAELERGGR